MGAETGERSALTRTQGGSHGLLHAGATRADQQVHHAFEDYVWITAVLEEEKERLDKDAERFLDADVNGQSP